MTKSTALDGRAFNISCTQIDIGKRTFLPQTCGIVHTDIPGSGNAQTSLLPRPEGLLQGDGRRIPEATFDPKHVGEAIVHISGLPLDVTVLTFNIMYVGTWRHSHR